MLCAKTVVLAALFASCLPGTASLPNRTLSLCNDAKDCFGCFGRQECVENTVDGSQSCSPCGWCTDDYDETNWDKDTYGACVVASPRMRMCAEVISPDSDPMCPESVCKQGDAGCACVSNVCPAIDLILGLFSMEGFWLLLFLVLMLSIGLMSACMLNSCFRPSPREVIVYREDTPPETYVRMDQ